MNTSRDEKTQSGISVSPHWTSWLKEHKISLMFTSSRKDKIFIVGPDKEEKLAIFENDCAVPMGLCCINPQRIYVGIIHQIWQLENIIKAEDSNIDFDCLYLPVATHTTGSIAIHDMGIDKDENVLFINALFSCLCTPSDGYSFRPIWKPKFISKVVPQDRCHLNGLAMKDGKAKYITAFCNSDVEQGWRKDCNNKGLLIDIESNEIICQELCMPHSPRWYRDKLWVCNSGTGEFGFIDLEKGCFEAIAFFPGYLRGLCFVGDFAIIGSSDARESPAFRKTSLFERLEEAKTPCFRGLQVIDLRDGSTPHFLDGKKVFKELNDVIPLQDICIPGGFLSSRRALERSILIDDANNLS